MGFFKAHWRILVFSLVCLGSLGAGGWAYMAGDDVIKKLTDLDKLRRDVEGARRSATNSDVIKAKKKQNEEAVATFNRGLGEALAVQMNSPYERLVRGSDKPVPRKPLLDKVLPKPSRADAINFKDAYREAMKQLREQLRAADKPSAEDIREFQARKEQLRTGGGAQTVDNPWIVKSGGDEESGSKRGKSRMEVLREHPKTRAAEDAARRIYMYLTGKPAALGEHKIARMEEVPTDVQIWQAQMSLWIQQDLVSVLAGMNRERAQKLQAEGHNDQLWVAYMPIKHLIALRIENRLGNGGGSNIGKAEWAPTFTNINNSDRLFVVPLQLDLVVEEAALPELLDRLCRAGFYTPLRVNYKPLKLNPLYEDYIYGEAPVVAVTIDLEGYYFRRVFEQWIPDSLKPVLKTRTAEDSAARP